MYRDDDAARASRADALIDEIAELERQKVAHAAAEQRLEAARHELRALQAAASADPAPRERSPGLATHVCVFALTAGAAFLGYTLLS